jgi:hypothetical protein
MGDNYNSFLTNQRAIGPPDLVFMPLEEAVAAYVRTQSGYEQRHTASGGPQLWDPQWVPFTIASGHVLCDCSVAPEEPTPIRLYDPGALGEAVREPRAQSLAELVGWWLEAFSSGAWRFVKAADEWRRDYDRLPPPLQRSWLG